MTRKELDKIYKWGRYAIHRKHGSKYKIHNIEVRMKNPINGEWVDAVTYSNDEMMIFCRSLQSFLEDFDADLDNLNYCKKNKCGQCGYYAPYSKSDGTPDDYGNCLSKKMNKECNDGVLADDETPLVEVDEKDDACALFRIGRTKRTRDFIKKHPTWYSVKRLTHI